jgi:hypothetical protein
VRLAGKIDWNFLAGRFSSVCRVGLGQPPLPTRLVAGLLILKHMHNLSDEALCERWVENPYFQHFCGEVVFRHELPFDRSSLTRWRQRLGEEQTAALLQESLSVATAPGRSIPVALQSGEQVFGMRNGLSTLGAPNTTLADNLSSEDKVLSFVEFRISRFVAVTKGPAEAGPEEEGGTFMRMAGFILGKRLGRHAPERIVRRRHLCASVKCRMDARY